MATFSSITKQHIEKAIAECDERGQEDFLSLYGLTAVPGETFTHEGTTYDSRAIVGVAHRFATGQVAHAEEFKGADVAAHFLKKCGFTPNGVPTAAPRARKAASRATTDSVKTKVKRPRGADDRPVLVCPNCFQQLPATGICDNCD